MNLKKIKGITIELGGDVQPLNNALESVNEKSKDLQDELKHVGRLLKLDPRNTTLVAQKQKLLGEAIETTKTRLNTLRQAEKQVQEQFKRGKVGEEQYRALQREIVEAEQDLKRLSQQMKQTGATAEKLGKRMADVGRSLTMKVTAPLLAGFGLAIQGTKELRGDLATLETNAKSVGQEIGVLNELMAQLAAVTGETDSNVEGLSNLMAAGFQDEKLTELVDVLSGAAIKFKDTMKFEGMADGLQETIATGKAIGPFAELLDRSGISANTFNAGLAKAIALGKEHDYVLKVLSRSGLAETYEAYRKNNKGMVEAAEANFRLQQAMAKLGTTLEPLLTPLIEGVSKLVNMFNKLSPAGKKVTLSIAGIAAALGPVSSLISKLIEGFKKIGPLIKSITNLKRIWVKIQGVLNVVLAANPIGVIVVALGMLVVGIVKVVKHWDDFREAFEVAGKWIKKQFNTLVGFFEKIADTVVDVFNGIKEKVLGVWASIVDGVKGFINKIIDGINYLINALNKIPGVGIGEIGKLQLSTDIPKLHSGGVFRAPVPGGEGLALLRDREVVLPAGGATKSVSTNNKYIINVSIPAKDLEEMRTVQDFFKRIGQTTRTLGLGEV